MRKSFRLDETGFVRVCGHRGHNDGAPENTIPAFETAHALGATSVEIDTALSADDTVMVIHDLLVDRTTNGIGAVADMTAADIAGLDAGAWFSPTFAGTRVPTLRETLTTARRLDLVLEVEIKEKLRLNAFAEALAETVADDLDRVMMISFDHANLRDIKRRIPGIRTGGIVHERFPDPVAVARAADLDELCIDLDVFDPADARELHRAGISIRCHAYKPEKIEAAERAGLGWTRNLEAWLTEGLIDTLSGDDVAWVNRIVNASGRGRADA